MTIIIKYNNINHSVEVGDDISRAEAMILFERLLMSADFQFEENTAQDIILCSNKLLGVVDWVAFVIDLGV